MRVQAPDDPIPLEDDLVIEGNCNGCRVELQGGGSRPCPVWHGQQEANMRRIVNLFQSAGLTIKRK